MPKISVIIPVYNVERYLERCLNSVLSQSFHDFEVICVDDGSSDATVDILQNFAQKDKRIIAVFQQNQGVASARNNALAKAQGDYVFFLDSDDALEAQAFEIVYNTAQKYNADMVCFDYQKSDGVQPPKAHFDISKIRANIYDRPFFCGCRGRKRISFNVWTKFYKKELLDGIKFISGIHFEDYPYVYSVLLKSPKTVVLPAKLYLYTQNFSSISHQKANPKQISDYYTGISYLIKLLSDPKYIQELNFFKKDGLPQLLKHQYQKCKQASGDNAVVMWKTFADELVNLKNANMLVRTGHNFWRYWQYQKLLRQFKN